MSFDYPVNLDLAGRRCVVFGGGPVALERAEGLLASGAHVVVVAPAPDDGIRTLMTAGAIGLVERDGVADDLTGAFLGVHTREDGDADQIAALWDRANATGVLFAALDDVDHCMFGAMSIVRRGALRITVSTGGKAPALAKRIRHDLEQIYDERYGDLVEVLHDARQQALPRDVPFGDWAARWEVALADLGGLLEELDGDGRAALTARILATIAPEGRDAVHPR